MGPPPDDVVIRLDGTVGATDGAALRIGLINNMPDPALRRTEQQFKSLLAAAIDAPVELVLVTLPQIARSDWAAEHVAQAYVGVDDFLASDLDAVIVTGAEPRAKTLSEEPYWGALSGLFDWIEDTRLPAAYCCLAAHAAVLHRDGIQRRPLPQKCFGIFEHEPARDHPFTADAEPSHVLPHSRWNEITERDLLDSGYVTLSRSAVGVGAFARSSGGRELFFQGHPEYGGTTLLREYRRDVRRFLTGERDTYPEPPVNGIGDAAMAVFEAFRERALTQRDPALFEAFPSFDAADARSLPWRPAAARIYGNWLQAVVPSLHRGAGPAAAERLHAGA